MQLNAEREREREEELNSIYRGNKLSQLQNLEHDGVAKRDWRSTADAEPATSIIRRLHRNFATIEPQIQSG